MKHEKHKMKNGKMMSDKEMKKEMGKKERLMLHQRLARGYKV